MEYDTVRIFRVDRITSLENAQKTHDIAISLVDWIENHSPRLPVRLYVTLTREGVRQCRSEPWLEPHVVMIDEEYGYIDTEIDTGEIDFVASYFFRLGSDATVVEPQEIIESIKQRAHTIIRHYQ